MQSLLDQHNIFLSGHVIHSKLITPQNSRPACCTLIRVWNSCNQVQALSNHKRSHHINGDFVNQPKLRYQIIQKKIPVTRSFMNFVTLCNIMALNMTRTGIILKNIDPSMRVTPCTFPTSYILQ